jgi:di/tricarboxylate transporter
MSYETIFVFATVVVAAVLFASNRVRLDIVAILVVLALMLSGVLTAGEALAGFGDPVVILVASLLVVGEMLDRTGVAQSIGTWIIRTGGNNETRLLVLIMLAAAALSSIMSSTAVVAIFIPIVFKVANRTGLEASRMLLPMSYAAMISGMLTLIATTPNLVVSAELEYSGFQPLGFFSFFPIGLVVLAVGIVYILFVGRRLLPDAKEASTPEPNRTLQDLRDDFGLNHQVHRARVTAQSSLVGKLIGETDVENRYQVYVLGIDALDKPGRQNTTLKNDTDNALEVENVLLVLGNADDISTFAEEQNLQLLPDSNRDRQRMLHEHGACVVLIHPDCRFIGKSLREIEFRSWYGVHVVGIRRGKTPLDDRDNQPLASGDALLVEGFWSRIAKLRDEVHDFVLLELPAEFEEVRPAHRRAPIAIGILLGMVVLSASGLVPVVAAVLIAALAAVASRCLTMEDAYRSISWSSIVLLAGMLPVADALYKTGGMDILVDTVVSGIGSAGPYAMMTLLFFLTAGLSLFLSNTASAVLIAPVAIQSALAMDVSPYTFAVVVLIGASAAFASPVASPVVTLVVEPGRYRFVDFMKVGAPLMLLTYIATMIVTPILFPL